MEEFTVLIVEGREVTCLPKGAGAVGVSSGRSFAKREREGAGGLEFRMERLRDKMSTWTLSRWIGVQLNAY